MPSPFTAHINITHGEDMDGLCSQVLIRRFWREQAYTYCEFYQAKYVSMQAILEKLTKRKLENTHFVISDISLMDKFLPALQILAGKNTSNHIDYYDHHEASREKRDSIPSQLRINCYIGPDEKCSTLLIQEHLFPRDPRAQYLAQEANHSDLKDPGQSPENRLLGRLIAMKATANFDDPEIDRIASIIATPEFYADPWLRSLMDENERVCQADLDAMLKAAGIKIINGIKIAYGWAQFASPGEIATELLRKHKGDVAIGLNPNGRGSVKSRIPQLRADKIAEMWGGGGHEDRAGFDWNLKTDSYQNFLEHELFLKLEKHFKLAS
jgi:oligoribonuclease NrnB/cAMP/cGMP phosphodiesterase (DHH superfamily)